VRPSDCDRAGATERANERAKERTDELGMNEGTNKRADEGTNERFRGLLAAFQSRSVALEARCSREAAAD